MGCDGRQAQLESKAPTFGGVVLLEHVDVQPLDPSASKNKAKLAGGTGFRSRTNAGLKSRLSMFVCNALERGPQNV
jgi:hypothetical protein